MTCGGGPLNSRARCNLLSVLSDSSQFLANLPKNVAYEVRDFHKVENRFRAAKCVRVIRFQIHVNNRFRFFCLFV